MADVESRTPLFVTIIARIVALRTAAGEDVGCAGPALTRVNCMRPGIRNRTSHTVSQVLIHLGHKAVVPAIQSGLDDVDARIALIDPVSAHIDWRRIGPYLVASRVVDAVSI